MNRKLGGEKRVSQTDFERTCQESLRTKKYIYIIALNYGPNEPVGFRHTFVDAIDDDDAYWAGFNVLQLTSDESQRRMNDYVVEL